MKYRKGVYSQSVVSKFYGIIGVCDDDHYSNVTFYRKLDFSKFCPHSLFDIQKQLNGPIVANLLKYKKSVYFYRRARNL